MPCLGNESCSFMRSDVCQRALPKIPFSFFEFHWRPKWHFFYLLGISLGVFPRQETLLGMQTARTPQGNQKAWPGATLLFVVGETENNEGEKIWSVVTTFCKLKNQTQIQGFPAQGSGW